MSSRVDSRHDRKRGRSRSPERKSRNVSVKSSSSRDRGGNSGTFKAPPAPKDKITQILQVKNIRYGTVISSHVIVPVT